MWSLARLTAAQDGVLTARQAAALDISRNEIFGHTSRDDWSTLARGVYRVNAVPYTERAMVRAAALTLGAVLDRTTAAWWRGLVPDLPEPLTMSVRHHRKAGRWPGSAVDLCKRSFCAEDVTEVDHLLVVGADLAVLGSIGAVRDPLHFVEQLLYGGEVTIESLKRTLGRNKGMHGLGPARKLVALLDSKTQGKAERIFRQLLIDHQIPECGQQYRFRGWPLDFAWPELKVVVEIDGFAYHRGQQQFRRDMAKRNALTLDGWLVLTFSYHDLVEDPIGCIETLVAALTARVALVD